MSFYQPPTIIAILGHHIDIIPNLASGIKTNQLDVSDVDHPEVYFYRFQYLFKQIMIPILILIPHHLRESGKDTQQFVLLKACAMPGWMFSEYTV